MTPNEVVMITWPDVMEASGDQCDFCLQKLPFKGSIPILVNLIIETTPHSKGPIFTYPGPWALCRRCQRFLRVIQGQTEIDLLKVKELHLRTIDLQLRQMGHPDWQQHMVHKMWVGEEPLQDLEPVAPGISLAPDGTGHIDPVEMIESFGIPNTVVNRARVVMWADKLLEGWKKK